MNIRAGDTDRMATEREAEAIAAGTANLWPTLIDPEAVEAYRQIFGVDWPGWSVGPVRVGTAGTNGDMNDRGDWPTEILRLPPLTSNELDSTPHFDRGKFVEAEDGEIIAAASEVGALPEPPRAFLTGATKYEAWALEWDRDGIFRAWLYHGVRDRTLRARIINDVPGRPIKHD